MYEIEKQFCPLHVILRSGFDVLVAALLEEVLSVEQIGERGAISALQWYSVIFFFVARTWKFGIFMYFCR
jgi:hypothetical protein